MWDRMSHRAVAAATADGKGDYFGGCGLGRMQDWVFHLAGGAARISLGTSLGMEFGVLVLFLKALGDFGLGKLFGRGSWVCV